jgi:hypothetical protein
LALKPVTTVFTGLASKPVVTVSSGLASKPVALIFAGLASKPVTMVSHWFGPQNRWQWFVSGLTSKPLRLFLPVWPENRWRQFFG